MALKKRKYKKKKVKVKGKQFILQGYEPFFVNQLDKFSLSIEDITEIPIIPYFFQKKLRRYYPDFYIQKLNTIVEIKSSWTMRKNIKKNAAKWNSVVCRGYKLWIIIYDAKGNILEHIKR